MHAGLAVPGILEGLLAAAGILCGRLRGMGGTIQRRDLRGRLYLGKLKPYCTYLSPFAGAWSSLCLQVHND